MFIYMMDNYIEKCIMHTLFIRIEYGVKLVRFFLEKIGGELKSYLIDGELKSW